MNHIEKLWKIPIALIIYGIKKLSRQKIKTLENENEMTNVAYILKASGVVKRKDTAMHSDLEWGFFCKHRFNHQKQPFLVLLDQKSSFLTLFGTLCYGDFKNSRV